MESYGAPSQLVTTWKAVATLTSELQSLPELGFGSRVHWCRGLRLSENLRQRHTSILVDVSYTPLYALR